MGCIEELVFFSFFLDEQARVKVEPIIARFQDSTEALTKLAQDVRVRSEQFVDLARLRGPSVEAMETVTSRQMHVPSPKPPTFLQPLPNMHVAEGTRVVLETTFDSGVPQSECRDEVFNHNILL